MSEIAVRFDEVSKAFGETKAVNELSLDIQQGEFLTLLGSSGCGKTTTLRLINGFETADSGTIYINNKDVSKLPPYNRNVNTVFQSYALFPHLNIYDNIAYGLVIKGMPRKEIRNRVFSMLEKVGLVSKAKNLPGQLSGGQMQRVALVRALINEPEVLLLDEPLGALDAKLRKSMQLELKDMHKRLGITFVYVTHDQDEALVMSDRIAVMEGGRIAHLDTPREIYSKPKTRFVADFVGKSNFLQGVVGNSITGGRRSFVLDGAIEVLGILSDELLPGEKVTIGIRSHAARVLPGEKATPSTATIPARIKDIIYAGPVLQIIVNISPNQTSMLIEQSEDLATFNLQTGDEIAIAINVDEIVHFRNQ